MPRLDEFVADVARSGLLDRSALDRARAALPPGPDEDAADRLARLLVDRGDLTPYQARKLLAGVTRGFILGGYRILRSLGQGGMGKVYLARGESNGELVAIKVLPPRKAVEEEQALARFRRETDLSRRVVHPNLARALGVGQEDDVHFMILEYVPGDSLYNLVKSRGGGPLPVPTAAALFMKILDGLNAAHDAGLVHRDIKPSNLMVTPEGRPKILDLGLARALGEENPITRSNTVLGTLDYASPEQLSDAARADARSDLYSLGCTLYFAVSGRPPFVGGDAINKIFRQRMEDPPPLERVARGVPAAFAAIVRKLMSKEPADRYRDGREVQADLARWTDPAIVQAVLNAGSGHEARQFRPPPPLGEDEDLRLLDAPSGPRSKPPVLRSFGEAEPRPAPRHRPPEAPRRLLILSDLDESEDGHDGPHAAPPLPRLRPPERDRWLLWVVALICAGVALLLLFFALLR